MSTENTKNVFPVYAKVLLEGVEVPLYSISVSYGINSAPTCTVIIPAYSKLRELPENTKILILYKNPQDSITDKWYVLFDGELQSMIYSIDPNAATMTLQGIHAVSYLELMQLLVQPAITTQSDLSNIGWVGPLMEQGTGTANSQQLILFDVILGKGSDQGSYSTYFKSMADLVFIIIKSILEPINFNNLASTKIFKRIVIDMYKLTDRIVNVSSNMQNIFEQIKKTIEEKGNK